MQFKIQVVGTYVTHTYVNFITGIHPENIPVDILPKEYGGEACSIPELDDETKRLCYKYIQWLKDSESLKVDDSKRPKKQSWWSYLTGTSTVPSPTLTIEQQKEEFLKTLQIDQFNVWVICMYGYMYVWIYVCMQVCIC